MEVPQGRGKDQKALDVGLRYGKTQKILQIEYRDSKERDILEIIEDAIKKCLRQEARMDIQRSQDMSLKDNNNQEFPKAVLEKEDMQESVEMQLKDDMSQESSQVEDRNEEGSMGIRGELRKIEDQERQGKYGNQEGTNRHPGDKGRKESFQWQV